MLVDGSLAGFLALPLHALAREQSSTIIDHWRALLAEITGMRELKRMNDAESAFIGKL